jgi:hypothetical protein
MSEIITFPGHSTKRGKRASTKPDYAERRKNRKSMRKLLFRSYDVIIESDEAELISDVGLEMHKAEVKLRKLRQALQATREYSAARIEMLTEAEIKLSAALVAALLSTQGQR